MFKKDIFEDLYKIVENNMKEAGKEMEFSKELLFAYANHEPDVLDVEALLKVKKDEVLETAYFLGLDRYPEDGAIEAWDAITGIDDMTFKRSVAKTIIESEEFKVRGKRYTGYYEEAVKEQVGTEEAAQSAGKLQNVLGIFCRTKH